MKLRSDPLKQSSTSGAEPESSVRIDKWLWAVRIYKTRTLAADACKAGHVKLNGKTVKPSHVAKPGQKIEARVGDNERIVIIKELLEKRVGAKLVDQYLDDHTPKPDPSEKRLPNFIPVPMRSKGAGRPTKKERRQIDSLHN